MRRRRRARADGRRRRPRFRRRCARWRDIEGFVREKERWILAKLEEWSVAPRPVRLRGESGERLPLFGERRTSRPAGPGQARGRHARRCGTDQPGGLAEEHRAAGAVPARRAFRRTARPARAARRAVERAHAMGRVHRRRRDPLSWRLVHIDPSLADYVVAHEARTSSSSTIRGASGRWSNGSIRAGRARERLELAGAALPILRGTR